VTGQLGTGEPVGGDEGEGEGEADRQHGQQVGRGWTLQQQLRAALVLLVVASVVVLPPARDPGLCLALAGAYLGWFLVLAVLAARQPAVAARWGWTALFVDLTALAALTLLAARSDGTSWTAAVLAAGFFLLPVLAATQLRPLVVGAVGVPTVVLHLLVDLIAQRTDGEPTPAVLLKTAMLAALTLACVLLGHLQRSRVQLIAQLSDERAGLLAETAALEQRERRDLAEHLHDGALQYVLAARQDLEEVRDDPAALDRVEEALRRSSALLRSTMSSLHPAVLDAAGLPAALRDLTASVADRGGFSVELDTGSWPAGFRTPDDPLLHATARELLVNVTKHARARRVQVRLALDDGRASVVVADDGTGVPAGLVERRVGEGHVGLWARRARLELAGGGLLLEPGPGGGTVVTAWLPV
jgi:two-component system NarL family sensor kinase